MGVSEGQIEEAFEQLQEAFWSLADLEDEVNELKWKMENEFKEGSQSMNDAKLKMYNMKPDIDKAHREFKLALWHVEKLKMLIEIDKSR